MFVDHNFRTRVSVKCTTTGQEQAQAQIMATRVGGFFTADHG
jgi:hypothetical protein